MNNRYIRYSNESGANQLYGPIPEWVTENHRKAILNWFREGERKYNAGWQFIEILTCPFGVEGAKPFDAIPCRGMYST